MTKIIIFDFDGTLADTLNTLLNISNRLSSEFGYKSTTPEELEQLRHLTSWQIIRYSGISLCKLPCLLRRLKAEFNNEIKDVRLFSGIPEMILDLKKMGYQLGIITSNSEENVSFVMEKHHLKGCFNFIYSSSNLFSKHKVIHSWLKQNNIEPNDVVYVGDETRDINAAKKAKIKVISVSWGFHTQENLETHKPDGLIDSPEHLREVLKSWK